MCVYKYTHTHTHIYIYMYVCINIRAAVTFTLGKHGRIGIGTAVSRETKKSSKYLNDSHQIKSLQWLQKVGCLKKRGTNLWSLISKTFFCLKAPRRCTPFTATGSESAIFALTVSIRVCVRESKGARVRAGVDFKASARALIG